MTGGVLEIGETDARLLFLLHHHDGAPAAAIQTVVAHVTAGEARAFPWPDRIRACAERLATEVPEGLGPRSIGLDPVETQADLTRADALGLRRTGLGVVGTADCDAFGRLRTEGFMHRLSDAIPNLFAGRRPGNVDDGPPKIGGAAVEYRLVHHAWPRVGDRLELRSGSAGGDARIRRLVHWMLDPDTGRPWASAEAIAVSFDLATRKLISLSADELARAEADCVPGLGL